MSVFQINDWDTHFENDRSRQREKCSFVCVPNKQHGMGFCRIMAEPDGAAIYGIWHLILGACSQQTKRDGWLTSDGDKAGTPWGVDDLALKFRRPEKEIVRAFEVLCSEKVKWITHHGVTVHSPPSPLKEEKERIEKKEMNGGWLANSEQIRICRIMRRKETTRWSKKEVEAWKLLTPIADDDFLAVEKYYRAKLPADKDYRRRDLSTLLNNWNGEVDRARNFKAPSIL